MPCRPLRRLSAGLAALCVCGAGIGAAAAAEVAGTVSEVAGDNVVIRASGPVRSGDEVQILMRIPGFDEPGLVGSGTVIAVGPGHISATIRERSGTLAVGQMARIRRAGSAAAAVPGVPGPVAPPTASDAGGSTATTVAPATAPAAGSVSESGLEAELNQALQSGGVSGVTASVGAAFVVTLRGSVPSAADKQRALRIARSFREAAQVKDQVFVVE